MLYLQLSIILSVAWEALFFSLVSDSMADPLGLALIWYNPRSSYEVVGSLSDVARSCHDVARTSDDVV